MKFLIFTLLCLNAHAESLECSQSNACLQSIKEESQYSEPITYEQSKEEATKLLKEVLTTLEFSDINLNNDELSALKTSSLLRVKTHILFSFKESNKIHFKINSDSPKLDWGDTSSLIEKVKFRFFQNNM